MCISSETFAYFMRKIIFLLILNYSLGLLAQIHSNIDFPYLKDEITSSNIVKSNQEYDVTNNEENVEILFLDSYYAKRLVDKPQFISVENQSVEDNLSRIWRPKGYRGFFEVGFGRDIKDKSFSVCPTTIHGYQLNPKIFVGVGISAIIEEYTYIDGIKNETVHSSTVDDWPIFADFRYTFTRTRVSPYVEPRVGVLGGKGTSLFASLSAGVDIAIKTKFAFNIGVEYAAIDVLDKSENKNLYIKLGLNW